MLVVVIDSPPPRAGRISSFGLSYRFVPPSAPSLIRCAESLLFKLTTQNFGADKEKHGPTREKGDDINPDRH